MDKGRIIPLVRIAQKRALMQIKKISKGTIKEAKDPKKIIFNRVYTRYDKTIYHEIGIAKALQLMGHDVKFLICGGRFKNCTSVFTIQQKESQSICQNCATFGPEILNACGIPFDTYENILSQHGRDDNVPLKMEKYVNNSVSRYFKGYDPIRSHLDFSKVREDRSCNIVDSLSVAEIIYEREKPDIIFTTHYAYSEWAPFVEYMQSKKVRCVVWDYIYGDTHMIFDLERLSAMFTVYSKNHKSLNKDEHAQLQKYLNERRYGKADTQSYGFKSNQSLTNDKKYDNVYAMFPNVPWDSSLANANKIFGSIYDWIGDTINYFKSNQNNFLYIKIHPAEVIDKSQMTVVDYINNHFSPLTENIKIIDVDEGISPYSLYDTIDAGIVYNGTAGLEMSVLGVPVIVVGHIYYEGQGFTYEPKTVSGYHQWLDNPPSKLDKKQVKKAEEFGYYYFMRSRVPMLYAEHSRLGARFTFNHFDRLLDDDGIKTVVRYILKGELYQEEK